MYHISRGSSMDFEEQAATLPQKVRFFPSTPMNLQYDTRQECDLIYDYILNNFLHIICLQKDHPLNWICFNKKYVIKITYEDKSEISQSDKMKINEEIMKYKLRKMNQPGS